MLESTTEPGGEEIQEIKDVRLPRPPPQHEEFPMAAMRTAMPVTTADLSELKPVVCDADLQQAAMHGDVDAVRYLIGAGTSVNAPLHCNDAPDGDVFQTLMHILASQPQLQDGIEVLAEIVKMKANLNARSSLGATPLSCACLHKHVAAVELLLAYGADVKPRDDTGRDAVHCAVILAHARVITRIPSNRSRNSKKRASQEGKKKKCAIIQSRIKALRGG